MITWPSNIFAWELEFVFYICFLTRLNIDWFWVERTKKCKKSCGLPQSPLKCYLSADSAETLGAEIVRCSRQESAKFWRHFTSTSQKIPTKWGVRFFFPTFNIALKMISVFIEISFLKFVLLYSIHSNFIARVDFFMFYNCSLAFDTRDK